MIEKTTKKHYQIRDYEWLQEVLGRLGLADTKEGIRVLKLVGKPAARAQKKEDSPRGSPDKDEWEKAYDAAMDALSMYIRTRDTKDFDGVRRGKCVTCENWYEFKQLQCGHWQSTKYWGTKFHVWNNHAQCWPCNDKMRGNGKMPQHEAAIRLLHGQTAPERLIFLTKTAGRKLTTKELIAIKQEFDRKREALP